MRKPARVFPGRLSALALVAAALLLALSLTSTASAEEPDVPVVPPRETSFDGVGTVMVSGDRGALPLEQFIQYFATNGQVVRWAPNIVPVAFCTLQAGRPSAITAEQFREAVRLATEMWNSVEAAVGVRYTGDCATGARVDLSNNRNEIGWDDSRNIVSGSQAGITQGSWVTGFGRRDFSETDIVLDNNLRVAEQCFRTVIAHEMGHAIGFGHSDTRGDLMFPSFTSTDVRTCRPSASTAEVAWLVGLYGGNQKPVVISPGDRTIAANGAFSLTVQASDPEGDSISYEWRQTAGPAVTLTAQGPSVSLIAPASGAITLEVSALDRYLHRATSTVTLTVTNQVPAAPPSPPSLQSIASNAARNAASLRWSLIEGAQSHEFCVTRLGTTSCTAQSTSSADVGWTTSLSSGGQADQSTVLALDMRATSMRACNTQGCSTPGVGPLIGGFRWTNWGLSYDVVAMAYDVPGTSIRFTIAGAVNTGISSRRFVLYTGPEEDPQRTLIRDCGILDPGQSCIGLLGSSDNGHGAYAVVESSALGTPGAVHRVRIR